MLRYPDYILYGKPVTIMHKGYYKQKKISRYRLLNFIYRILYGEEDVPDNLEKKCEVKNENNNRT